MLTWMVCQCSINCPEINRGSIAWQNGMTVALELPILPARRGAMIEMRSWDSLPNQMSAVRWTSARIFPELDVESHPCGRPLLSAAGHQTHAPSSVLPRPAVLHGDCGVREQDLRLVLRTIATASLGVVHACVYISRGFRNELTSATYSSVRWHCYVHIGLLLERCSRSKPGAGGSLTE